MTVEMEKTTRNLDNAWFEYNGTYALLPHEQRPKFTTFLREKYGIDFNTIVDLSSTEEYHMIFNRWKNLPIKDDGLEYKRAVKQAWYELNNHQYFATNKDLEYKQPIYLIEPMMVNDDGVVDDDPSKNVNLHYWYEVLIPVRLDKTIESYRWHYGGVDKIPNVDHHHAWQLDGGGKSYEDAILNLHRTMIDKYGEFKEDYNIWDNFKWEK